MGTARHPQACRKTDSLARVRQRARTPPAVHTDPWGPGPAPGHLSPGTAAANRPRASGSPPLAEDRGWRCPAPRARPASSQGARWPWAGAGTGGGGPRTHPQRRSLSPLSVPGRSGLSSTWALFPILSPEHLIQGLSRSGPLVTLGSEVLERHLCRGNLEDWVQMATEGGPELAWRASFQNKWQKAAFCLERVAESWVS